MTDEEIIEAKQKAAAFAAIIVDGLPDTTDELDLDLGLTAIIICGLLAGHIVEQWMTREKFIEQMNAAIDAKLHRAMSPQQSQ